MTAPRPNDARAKRIRAQLRREANPCHLCGGEIDYAAHHYDPRSFQVDHLWQVSNGGPEYDPANCASSHRGCNRQRSNRIDAIAVATAASYGVTLTPPVPLQTPAPVIRPCAPGGQHCAACRGTHDPNPGITFITARNWWDDDTDRTSTPTGNHPDDPYQRRLGGVAINLEGLDAPR